MAESFIVQRLLELQFLGYAAVFIGMMVEGEAFLFAGIFLANTGYLNVWYTLLSAILGIGIGDILWYYGGSHLERLVPKRIIEKIFPIIDRHLQERPVISIFLAKFIYFLHRWVLVRVRPNGIDLKTFLKADYPAAALWVFIVSVIGLAFSASFQLLRHYLRFAEIGLLIGIVAFVALEHYAGRYLRRVFER